MPVTFHVDPDFYDHPKCIGLSDAAVALWVRAGSYSVAKLTDGLITVATLALLSRDADAAADELVRAGLWRRARGGFRFHQWGERNLTRAAVSKKRKAWRDEKRNAKDKSDTRRSEGKFSGPESGPESDPESARNPVRILTHGSGSGSGSGSGGETRKRAHRLPDDWQPDDGLIAWAAAKCPDVNYDRAVERFRNFWHSSSGSSASKLDWRKAFQNWMLKDQTDLEAKRPAKVQRLRTSDGRPFLGPL